MILVTGATGNIGITLVRMVLAKGAEVRVLACDPARAEEHFGRGKVEIARGDFDDPGSVARALEGATKLSLLATGPNVPAQESAAIDGAKAAGVMHIAMVSSLGVEMGVSVAARCTLPARRCSRSRASRGRSCGRSSSCRMRCGTAFDPLGGLAVPADGHRKGQPDSPGGHRGGRRGRAHDRRARGPRLQAHGRRGAHDGGRRFVGIYFSVIDEMLFVRKPSTLAIHGSNRRQA
jgi:NAD(P)H-binding